MGYDVRAVRAPLSRRWPRAPRTSTDPAAPRCPTRVAAAVADTLLVAPGQPRRRHRRGTGGGRRSSLAARAAMADLLGADSARGDLRPQHDRADLRPGPHARRRRGARATRSSSPGSTTTRTSARGSYAAEAVGAVGALGRVRPRAPPSSPSPTSRASSPSRTRLVAVTGASNLLGTRPPVALIAAAAHERGALVFVDGVHLTAHAPVDVAALGRGPLRLLALQVPRSALRRARGRPAPAGDAHARTSSLPSTDAVPERFELGTLPYELLAGTTAAVDFLAGLDPDATGTRRERLTGGMTAVEKHEDRLRRRIEDGLAALPGVGRALPRRCPAPRRCCCRSPAATPQDAYRFLAESRRQRPGRHLLRAGGVAAARVSATAVRCGSGSRPTPTTTTSTGCSPAWTSSSPARRKRGGDGRASVL